MERRRGFYLLLGVALTLGLGVVMSLAVALGDSWWQLATAVLLAFVLAQFGFLGHDAAHRQVLSSSSGNEWLARVLSTGVVGLSYGWWTHKHSRHHSAPNQVGRDPDIAPGGLVFTPEEAVRRSGAGRWMAGHQGALFFPLLLLEGLNLHAASLRAVVVNKELAWRRLELALLLTRLGGYVALVVLALDPLKAAAFLTVQLGVFGVLLGGAFAPNHKGMPIVPRGSRVDFLRRQVLMSRNIRGGAFLTAAMGGLNYQIEHHLFPSMPRANLRHARPLVRAYCTSMDVPYAETGLVASYAIVVRYLNQVGLGQRDPFTCPMVEQYRS
jgi:fatty acid desaturase